LDGLRCVRYALHEIYFRDPDGHLLEYIAMLGDDPRLGGVLTWHEWTRSRSFAAIS
jgi:hypothetical protein